MLGKYSMHLCGSMFGRDEKSNDNSENQDPVITFNFNQVNSFAFICLARVQMRILYIAMQALEITAFLWILHTNITQNVPTYTVVQGDT